MSKTVDQRVVEMQFDNRQFEKNVQTSMNTLDSLKQSLRFDGVSKGFDNITNAAKSISLSGIGNAVETVHAKFSALQVMAITALSNITNSAINAGKRIVSSLTLDPIKTGFSEYELKMGSIQTIMASTGESLETVNKYLAELNEYSDKTIYSFADMTSNIGKFTNAGVKLDDAVMAIKGISNEAAVSGANANEASRAMYNFAQALSAGYVKLIDWKSIENANMATVEFKKNLLDSAVAAGTLRKTSDGMYKVLSTNAQGKTMSDAIDATHNFNDSLSYQWMTTEALVGSLKQYADETTEIGKKAYASAQDVKTLSQLYDTLKESAQSGWATTWELIVGDFEEAKKFLTEISEKVGDILNKSSDARNALISGGLRSGWDGLMGEGIADEDAFKDVIGSIVGEKNLNDKIKEFGSFEESLKSGWLNANLLQGAVDKYTKSLESMTDKELTAAGVTKQQVLQMIALNSKIQNGTISMDEFAERISKPSGRENLIQALRNAFDGLSTIIKPVKEAFQEIFPPLTVAQLYDFTELLRDLTAKIAISGETAGKLKRSFKGLFAVFHMGYEGAKALYSGLVRLIDYLLPANESVLGFTATLGDWLVDLDEAATKSDVFNTAVKKIGETLKPVGEVVKKAIDKILSAFEQLSKIDFSHFESFGDVVDKVKEKVESFSAAGTAFTVMFEGVKKVFEKISKVFSAIGSAIGKTFTGFENLDFNSVLGALNSGMFLAVVKGIKDFVDSLTDVSKNASGIVKNIKDIFGGLKESLEAYQENLKANILLKIAAAIGILAVSMMLLACIDPAKLTAAIAAMSVLFVELSSMMTSLSNVAGGSKAASLSAIGVGLVGMSIGILIMSSALAKLSTIAWDDLIGGTVALKFMLQMMVKTAGDLSKNSKGLISGSIGLIAFAVAMRILVSSVKSLADLNVKQLIKGLGGVALLCTTISVFLDKTDLNKKGMAKMAGFIALALAIKVLASSVATMGAMDIKSLGKGLFGVAELLTAIGVFINNTDSKDLTSTAVGITIISAAMLILTKAVATLGSMDMVNLGTGLFGVAVLLTAIGVFASSTKSEDLISTAVGITIIAFAMTKFAEIVQLLGGMDIKQLGIGLAALAAVLVIVGVAMACMKNSAGGAASLLLSALAVGVLAKSLETLAAIPLKQIGKALLALAAAFTIMGIAGYIIGPMTPAILGLGAAMMLFGLGCLTTAAALLIFSTAITSLAVSGAAGAAALTAIVMSLISLIPAFLEQVARGVIAFGEVIANGAPLIINIITTIGSAVLAALIELIPGVVNVLLLLLDAVIQLSGPLCEAVLALIPPLIEALVVLLAELLKSLADHTPEMVQAGFDMLKGILKGIRDNIGEVVDIVVEIITEFVDALEENLPTLLDEGAEFIITFINDLADAIDEHSGELADAALNLADSIIDGMVNGLTDGLTYVVDKAAEVGDGILTKVKDVLGIHSPSKEMEKLGQFTDMGLANGLKRYSMLASNAASSVGEGVITPIRSMTNDVINSENLFNNSLRNMAKSSASFNLNSEISTEKSYTTRVVFDPLTVKGVNNQGEFVATADYAVDEVLTTLMRRQSRL